MELWIWILLGTFVYLFIGYVLYLITYLHKPPKENHEEIVSNAEIKVGFILTFFWIFVIPLTILFVTIPKAIEKLNRSEED